MRRKTQRWALGFEIDELRLWKSRSSRFEAGGSGVQAFMLQEGSYNAENVFEELAGM